MDNVEVATACKDEALEIAQFWKGRDWKEQTSKEEQIKLAKTFRIKIDVTGASGTGPHDILKADGYNAVAVNSSSKAKDPEQYANVRSELWFDQRSRAKDKRLDMSRLPKEMQKKLKRELGGPKYKAPGQKVVEPKATTKKRIEMSPDLADGANLAFYNAPSNEKRVIYS